MLSLLQTSIFFNIFRNYLNTCRRISETFILSMIAIKWKESTGGVSIWFSPNWFWYSLILNQSRQIRKAHFVSNLVLCDKTWGSVIYIYIMKVKYESRFCFYYILNDCCYITMLTYFLKLWNYNIQYVSSINSFWL